MIHFLTAIPYLYSGDIVSIETLREKQAFSVVGGPKELHVNFEGRRLPLANVTSALLDVEFKPTFREGEDESDINVFKWEDNSFLFGIQLLLASEIDSMSTGAGDEKITVTTSTSDKGLVAVCFFGGNRLGISRLPFTRACYEAKWRYEKVTEFDW